jgi:hypothetical protein
MKPLLFFAILLFISCNTPRRTTRDSGGLYLAKTVDSITWDPPYLCSWIENFPTCYNIAYKDTLIFAGPLKVVPKEVSGAQHDTVKIQGGLKGQVLTSGGGDAPATWQTPTSSSGSREGVEIENTLRVTGTVKLDIPGKAAGKILTSDADGVATWQTPASQTPVSTMFTIISDPPRLGTPVDATVYYYGTINGAPSTTANQGRYVLPFNCTLVAYSLAVRSSVAASKEASTLAVRLNNASDYVINTAAEFSGSGTTATYYSNTLNKNYNAGDRIELKWTTPTWATNPTNAGMHTILYFKLR